MADFIVDLDSGSPANVTSSNNDQSRDVTINRESDVTSVRSVGSSSSWETINGDTSPDGLFLLLVLLF